MFLFVPVSLFHGYCIGRIKSTTVSFFRKAGLFQNVRLAQQPQLSNLNGIYSCSFCPFCLISCITLTFMWQSTFTILSIAHSTICIWFPGSDLLLRDLFYTLSFSTCDSFIEINYQFDSCFKMFVITGACLSWKLLH